MYAHLIARANPRARRRNALAGTLVWLAIVGADAAPLEGHVRTRLVSVALIFGLYFLQFYFRHRLMLVTMSQALPGWYRPANGYTVYR